MHGHHTQGPALTADGRARALAQAVRRGMAEGSLRRMIGRAAAGHARVGYCPICTREAVFLADSDWYRDSYRCLRCDSIPRQRAFLVVLDRVAPDWGSLAIHESSPDGSSSERLRRDCVRYESSQFFPGVTPGTMHEGIRCEDLTRLSMPDGSVDLFVTQDVFEHVLDPETGFAEVARVLRPGGLHVFTVPWYRWQPSLVRARRAGGVLELFEESEYHSNPVDPAGSLVATEWGYDLPEVIFAASGLTTTAHALDNPQLGLAGSFLEVMVSRKSSP